MKIHKYVLKCDNCKKMVEEEIALGWVEIVCEMKLDRSSDAVDCSFRPGTSFCSKECAIKYFGKKLDELYEQLYTKN